jgi:hypothetical protein
MLRKSVITRSLFTQEFAAVPKIPQDLVAVGVAPVLKQVVFTSGDATAISTTYNVPLSD